MGKGVKTMDKVKNILLWAIGIASAFLLFSEASAEIFAWQVLAGFNLFAIFQIIRRREAYEN